MLGNPSLPLLLSPSRERLSQVWMGGRMLSRPAFISSQLGVLSAHVEAEGLLPHGSSEQLTEAWWGVQALAPAADLGSLFGPAGV